MGGRNAGWGMGGRRAGREIGGRKAGMGMGGRRAIFASFLMVKCMFSTEYDPHHVATVRTYTAMHKKVP
jgi:hypothetical protein